MEKQFTSPRNSASCRGRDSDMKTADIYGHPAALHTPQDFDRMEAQTGLKAMIVGHKIKMIPMHDFEIAAAQEWLMKIGAAKPAAA